MKTINTKVIYLIINFLYNFVTESFDIAYRILVRRDNVEKLVKLDVDSSMGTDTKTINKVSSFVLDFFLTIL